MTRRPLLAALAVLLLLAPLTYAAAIDISAYAWTDSPGGLSAVVPGDAVYYQIGVAVDPDFDPLGRPEVGNRGLATLVYDMISLEAEAQGIPIPPMWFAPSGYNSYASPQLRYTGEPYYWDSGGIAPYYGGGWGFDASTGVPIGGNTTMRPGSLLGGGSLMPLSWTADVDDYPGLQPAARLDVGHGPYIFPDADPILAGLQGGFDMSIDDPDNLVEGDGTWVAYQSYIDTTAWAPSVYQYDVIPTHVHVLDGTIDYTQDLGGWLPT